MSAYLLGMMHHLGLEIHLAADTGEVSVIVCTLVTTLTIFIYISYSKVAQTSWPRAVVSTNPGANVTKDKHRFLRWNFADGSTEVVIEPILQF